MPDLCALTTCPAMLLSTGFRLVGRPVSKDCALVAGPVAERTSVDRPADEYASMEAKRHDRVAGSELATGANLADLVRPDRYRREQLIGTGFGAQ